MGTMNWIILITVALILWLMPLGFWEERILAVLLVLWYFSPAIEDWLKSLNHNKASRE